MAPKNSFKPLTLETNSFAYSLTEGTNIPPPPPSPPPQAKPANGALPTTPNGDAETKDAEDMPPPAKKQHIDAQSPQSHASHERPSSVRKLLSFKALRGKAQRDSLQIPPNGKMSIDSHVYSARPGSPYGHSIVSNDSKQSISRKRSSGWFGSRRKSGIMDIAAINENGTSNGGAVKPVAPERKGPPPPTIPEFREFRSIDGTLSDGSLGTSAEDMFKDIK